MVVPSGRMNKVKKIGPNTEPCRTPSSTLVYEEESQFTLKKNGIYQTNIT